MANAETVVADFNASGRVDMLLLLCSILLGYSIALDLRVT